MLVPSMKPGEITREIKTDYAKIQHSTFPRLAKEYDRERKKLKIDKTRVFTKVYTIKTGAKNTWFLFFRKKLSIEKYTGVETLSICSVVYYYNNTGLRVFNCTTTDVIGVYTGHFFSRYNERLNLNMNHPIETVKHFFHYNCETSYTVKERSRNFYVIGFCCKGFALGEFQNNYSWLVHKTFVSNDMIRPDQSEDAKELFFKYQLQVAQSSGTAYSNTTTTGILKDKLKSLDEYDPD